MSATHVQEILIRTTPEKLWRAITDPEQTRLYFYGSRVETTWKPGARIQYRMPDDSIALEGELLEVVPGKKFSQMWHALWDDQIRAEAPHKVTWEITPMGPDVCKLTVTHEGLGAVSQRQVSGGLVFILSGLKTLLETGEPLRMEATA